MAPLGGLSSEGRHPPTTGLALPIAPSGPAAAGVVATTARGAEGWRGHPETVPELLGDLLHFYDPPTGFEEFLVCLDADAETPTEVFLSAPESDYVDALERTEIEGTRLSAMKKGRVIVTLRAIFSACGKVAPAFGTAAAAGAPAAQAPRRRWPSWHRRRPSWLHLTWW